MVCLCWRSLRSHGAVFAIVALLEILFSYFGLSRRCNKFAGCYESIFLYIVLWGVGKNRDKQMKYTVLLYAVIYLFCGFIESISNFFLFMKSQREEISGSGPFLSTVKKYFFLSFLNFREYIGNELNG
jgi:hypothetical protein